MKNRPNILVYSFSSYRYPDRGLSGLYSKTTTTSSSSSDAIPRNSSSSRNYNAVLQQFSRSYSLPPACDPMRVVSNLSRDGVLVITAPKRQARRTDTQIYK